MVTRKDIAREAGVSQGTVSNVLNGCGNVSSEKIRLVEAAVAKLGYTVNERAKVLRKGCSNVLGIILPNILFPQYLQCYVSFKNYAESHGYSANLYISDDHPEQELGLIRTLRSDMVAGVAVVSSLENAPEKYIHSGFYANKVLFMERPFTSPCHYIGFDYAMAGHYFGTQAASSSITHPALITGSLSHSNEQAFCESFAAVLRKEQRQNLRLIQTDYPRRYHQIFSALNEDRPDAFYLSVFSYVETLQTILDNFCSDYSPEIHTVSPLFSMPEMRYDKYELNYALLGQKAARKLIIGLPAEEKCTPVILPADGRRNWAPHPALPPAQDMALNLMLIDSPETFALQSLAQLYTRQTGVRINCYLYSYDEIYNMLSKPEQIQDFDILRLDITILSWFAERLLLPLEELDSSVTNLLSQYTSGIENAYSLLYGHIYALPFSPSVQMLYYRKDLFDDVMLRRIFQEQYKTTLKPPSTFKEFNQIASFFTRANNPESPVTYGTTLTLGSIGTAATEFMARYRSYSTRLHDAAGNLDFSKDVGCNVMEQLIELKNYSKKPSYTWWTDSAAGFAAGDEAMAIMYSNYATDLSKQDSKVIGKIGVAMVPGQNPLLGGASLGISRYCANPQKALDFLRWLCSEPIASSTALLDGSATCRSTYNNVEIQDTYPWMRSVHKSFTKIAEKRPPIQLAKPFNERLFLNIIGQATQKACSGTLTPEDAIHEAIEKIHMI